MEVSHNEPFLTDSPISVFKRRKKSLRLCVEAEKTFILETILQLLFLDLLGMIQKSGPKLVRAHFTNDCLKKEGLHRLHGSHCHQATREPQSFSC